MTYVIYTVQPGDTLYSIARMYGSSIQGIIDTNNMETPDLIYPGSVILIPVEEEYLETPPGSLIYTVQPGDSLYIISLLFKSSFSRAGP